MNMRFVFLISLLCLTACALFEAPPGKDASLVLRPASFADLPGWGSDTIAEALPALQASCARILKAPSDKAFGPIEEAGTYVDWQAICIDLKALTPGDNAAAHRFIERHFRPYEALAGNAPEGLFTGYYEAALRGSRTRYGPYRYPLHARPDDLVMVDLGDFRDTLKGQRIAGRVVGGNLKPYEDRPAIVAGQWPHAFEKGGDKVLVWVDDPVDAFFVQIQGSGVVELDDGNGQKSVMRIGYAGQNGHPYYAIGRELIARGELTKDNVSMQSIRAWLEANPDQADEIMNTNKSYVFFKESAQEGAIGGEGVVLTPGRSLAIDRSKLPYGLPLWVDIEMDDVCAALPGVLPLSGTQAASRAQSNDGVLPASFQPQPQPQPQPKKTAPPTPDLILHNSKEGEGERLIGPEEACGEARQPLRRLMIAQDTGGAINGAVRGDVFWGFGQSAEYLAGHMKAQGRYWALLPRVQ